MPRSSSRKGIGRKVEKLNSLRNLSGLGVSAVRVVVKRQSPQTPRPLRLRGELSLLVRC